MVFSGGRQLAYPEGQCNITQKAPIHQSVPDRPNYNQH